MSPITGSKSSDTPFTVGVALDGAGWHPAAWREASSRAEALFAAETWVELAELAETAGLDYLAIADELVGQADPADPAYDGSTVLGRLDAALLADWIAPRTSRIGLIPTVTTTHTEPFHVATGLQTLDHVSVGRAGWQLRISADAASAAAFGRRPAPEIDRDAVASGASDAGLDELLADAADSAEVARRLWDSWEDDAEIRDAATGRFLDRDRVHPIDFASERFSVAGPSIVPRSPQGQLPIVVLAHSAPVAELAARVADVVIVTPESTSPGPAPGAGAPRPRSSPRSGRSNGIPASPPRARLRAWRACASSPTWRSPWTRPRSPPSSGWCASTRSPARPSRRRAMPGCSRARPMKPQS